MTIFKEMSVKFYALDLEEIAEKLRAMEKWPSERPVDAVLSLKEARYRLANQKIIELVALGAVAIIQSGQDLIPVRIVDVMMGVELSTGTAKADIEVEKAIYGSDTLLKGMEVFRGIDE